jgi:catechol 2,3-dioxygenase-like lactoylglutathione lyase family enzyme
VGKFSFVILYVGDPPASAAFYAKLLGVAPADTSATFAMVPLGGGVMLGLWRRDGVAPPAGGHGTGGEIAFTVASPAEVEAAHRQCVRQGLPIAQAPTAMDFGHTFVATDPDGHRLRVFAPSGA